MSDCVLNYSLCTLSILNKGAGNHFDFESFALTPLTLVNAMSDHNMAKTISAKLLKLNFKVKQNL